MNDKDVEYSRYNPVTRAVFLVQDVFSEDNPGATIPGYAGLWPIIEAAVKESRHKTIDALREELVENREAIRDLQAELIDLRQAIQAERNRVLAVFSQVISTPAEGYCAAPFMVEDARRICEELLELRKRQEQQASPMIYCSPNAAPDSPNSPQSVGRKILIDYFGFEPQPIKKPSTPAEKFGEVCEGRR